MGFNINSMLQDIEDLVLVEDKIVTYRHVTMQLRVHINTAKQLLYAFINKPDLKEKLLVTYIVSGFTKDNTQLISLVRAEALDKIKKNYSKVTSEHVYSVQKYNPKPSEKDYYIAEMETLNLDREYSSIRIEEDIIRKTERPVNIPPPQDDSVKKPALKPTNNQPTKSPKKVINLFTKKPNSTEEKPESKEEKQEPTKKSNSVKEDSDTSKIKQASPKKNDKGSKKNVVQKGGGIGAFFSRQVATPFQAKKEPPKKIEVSNKENEKKNNVEEYERMEEDSPPSKEKETEVKVNEDHPKNTSTKTPVGKNKKTAKKKDTGKKRKSNVSHEEPKRRKRIMTAISDSESSDDGMSVDEEEERIPSPEPVPVPVIESDDEIIPPTPVSKGRKKVRKEVERTFKDEEGFVLTKKEYVYESCTDEDESPPCKVETPKELKEVKKIESKEVKKIESKSPIKENTKENKGKGGRKSKGSPTSKTSPQKNKQASIMSFFGKK